MSGASIKVISGTSVIATADTSVATTAAIKNVPNGTYVIEVSKADYETTTTTVVVNGDVSVDAVLKKIDKTVKVTNTYYVDKDGNKVPLENATIGQNMDLVVEFSGKISSTSANLNSIKIYKGSVLAVVNDVVVSKDRKSITIKHATLDDASEYTLKLSGVTAADGTLIAAKNVAFKTASDFVIKSLTINNVAQTDMSGVSSSNFATGNTVKVTFNRSIDTTSIDTDKITLTKVESNGVAVKQKIAISGIKVSGDTADTSKVLEFTLGTITDIDDDVYVLSIAGLKDLSGVEMASASYQFINDETALTLTANGSDGNALANKGYYYGLTSTTKADGTVLPGFKVTIISAVPVKESTVDADSVKLQKVNTTGSVETYTDVATDIKFDSTGKIITVTPKEALDRDATYRVISTTGIKSIYGNTVQTLLNQRFTTIDSVGPVITSTTPETGKTGVSTNDKVEVTFQLDKEAYFGTLANGRQDGTAVVATSALHSAAHYYVYNATDGVYVTASVSADKDTTKKTITVTIDKAALAKNKTYIVGLNGRDGSQDTAKGVIEDKNGNPLEASYQVQFTTEGVDAVAPTITQITNTTVKTGTVVKNNATNLDKTKTYNIEFSEKLDQNAGTIKVESYNSSTKTWSGAATWTKSVDYSFGTYKDTFDYVTISANKFTDNSLNRVTISGFKDAAGNIMDDVQFLLTFGNGPQLKETAGTGSTAINNGAGYPTGTKTLTVDSTTIVVGSFVSIALANGNTFVTSADTGTTGTTLVIKDALPSAVENDAVVTVLPGVVNGTSGVNKSASIQVVLEGAVATTCKVDTDTITDKTVYLTDVDGTIIPADVTSILSKNDKDACVTITPKTDLAVDTQYRVLVDGVKDTAGNSISNAKFAFKTAGETVTPDVKFVNITDDDLFTTYDRDSAIVLEFSGDLKTTGGNADDASAATNYTLQEVGGSPIAVKPVVDGKKVTLYPDTVLAADKTYTLTVANTITVGGNALSTNEKVDNVLTFKTSNQEDSSVHGSIGINKATFSSTTKVLKLTFDRPLTSTQTSIDNSYFKLTAGSLGVLVGTYAVISSDGLTLSMVVDTDNSAIIAGTTKIEVDNAKNITYVTSTSDVNVDKVAVTIEAE